MTKAVYLVDGARTPFIKARGKPGPFTPVDLAVQCGRPLLMRQTFDPALIDLVVLGCVNVVAEEMNPARVAALRLGLPEAVPAYTVQVNCGSGMLSIDEAFRAVESGRSQIALAGGAEALSHSPLVLRRGAVDWFARGDPARTPRAPRQGRGGAPPGPAGAAAGGGGGVRGGPPRAHHGRQASGPRRIAARLPEAGHRS